MTKLLFSKIKETNFQETFYVAFIPDSGCKQILSFKVEIEKIF